MNVIVPPRLTAPPQRGHILLHGVDWQAFEKLLEALSEQHVRCTYDRGTVELMSPLSLHEVLKRLFGQLFSVLSEELDFGLRGMASTTFCRPAAARALEPDECFYLSANWERLRDWRRVDLSVDPPPDIALEIDITTTWLNRMEVYASLHIPEVWSCDGESLRCHHLSGGAYEARTESRFLPFVPLGEVLPLFAQIEAVSSEARILRAMRAWVRQSVLPRYDAWRSQQPPAAP